MRKFLSAKVVRDLSPNADGGDLFVSDTSLPGFGVRVHPSGNKSFFWNSRQGRLSLGDTRDIKLDDAREMARQYKAFHKRGINVRDYLKKEYERNQAEQRRSQLTLQVAFEEYAALREKGGGRFKPWSLKSSRAYRIAWNHLAPEVGNKHPADITPPDWVRVLAEHRIQRPGASNQMIALMSSLYGWLTTISVHATDVTANPLRDIKKVSLSERTNFFRPEDLKRLYEVIDAADVFEAVAWRLLILTARRKSEIQGLEWSEIDFEKGVISIPASRTKTDRDDHIPITATIEDLLKSVPRQNGPLVFSRNGGHRPIFLDLKRARNWLGTVPDHTGDDWRIHDFRTSMGTAMDNASCRYDEKEIMLSHSLGALDKTYSRSQRLEVKKRWLLWWENQVLGR